MTKQSPVSVVIEMGFEKHLGMKVKVVSRQKYGSNGRILKLTHTPVFEEEVLLNQEVSSRVTRVSVDPP
jgi:hypothetical protein